MPRKRTTRKRADRINALVKLQQQSVGRIAGYWAALAQQVTGGDFNLSSWIQQYADLWKGLAEDTGEAIQLMFPADKR